MWLNSVSLGRFEVAGLGFRGRPVRFRVYVDTVEGYPKPRNAPLADLRKQNWAEFIPEYFLNKDLRISVHLSRDIAVGGDATIAGAAVFTHSNVPGAQSRQSLFFCFIVMGELR